ncbi:LytTR family DNA-binding domain-containing protein [Vagococcus salmoninarum]|uniref:LytTR family DNA-binding domain-containing protein n=1 Tax=Vagococcus salmoninarum TaxID=2739 RepID=UPI003F9D9AA4
MKSRFEVKSDALVLEVVVYKNSYDQEVVDILEELKELGGRSDIVSIRVKEGIQLLKQGDIECVEVYGEELYIRTATESYQTKGPLYQFSEKLNSQHFVKVSKSVLVNMNQLVRLENYFSGNMLATLTSGRKVTISRRYLKMLKTKLKV